MPARTTGVRQALKSHHPSSDPNQRTLLLRQRFSELGPVAVQFLDGLLAKQIQGKLQAQQLLALVAHYQRDDVRAALERAVRFGAFSLAAVRRILAAHARPKPLLDELAELAPRRRSIRSCAKTRSAHGRPATISTCSHPRKPTMKHRPKQESQPTKPTATTEPA